ncbi:MAG: hypothetical protein ABIY70_19810 [Capsulimonas sp.]|uniref:hypothetical protein n=1 Tax=Capsulimonas sp. TaxID=2494211 RepID=UPI00326515FC
MNVKQYAASGKVEVIMRENNKVTSFDEFFANSSFGIACFCVSIVLSMQTFYISSVFVAPMCMAIFLVSRSELLRCGASGFLLPVGALALARLISAPIHW